ncbi:MAG: DUF2164 domain-containing protein [Methanoregula sp.]|jgi:uncharacterized protein (DUF2164 family)
MRKESPINLSKERKAAMIAEIKHYFAKERNEELGDLAAEMVLDFIIEKLAPEFYNQGISIDGNDLLSRPQYSPMFCRLSVPILPL